MREIAEHANLGVGGLQRELARLVNAGILLRTRRGRNVHYQAARECPIHDELLGIFRKTLGVVGVIRQALEGLREGIVVAFVFGSVARGEEREGSDVDLMVVGEIRFEEVVGAVRPVEASLGREVNPSVFGEREFREKLREGNHFLRAVSREKKLFVMGGEDDLAGLAEERVDPRTPDLAAGDQQPARNR